MEEYGKDFVVVKIGLEFNKLLERLATEQRRTKRATVEMCIEAAANRNGLTKDESEHTL